MVRRISSFKCHELIKEKWRIFFFFTGKTKSLKPYFTKNTRRITWNRYTVCHIVFKDNGWPLKFKLHS